jgi:hypothetical protein
MTLSFELDRLCSIFRHKNIGGQSEAVAMASSINAGAKNLTD